MAELWGRSSEVLRLSATSLGFVGGSAASGEAPLMAVKLDIIGCLGVTQTVGEYVVLLACQIMCGC